MIKFFKYHGLGNDFVFFHYEDVKEFNHSKIAIDLCDRHTGIGADGIIIVKQNPLEMIYYNSDGSRAEMCGNGIRCFAKFIYDQKIDQSKLLEVHTINKIYQLKVDSFNPYQVTVNMGEPSYAGIDFGTQLDTMLEYKVDDFVLSSCQLGVPHTIIEVDSLHEEKMIESGKKVQALSLFKNSVNVNFYTIENSSKISMQTYERGAGLTLACGTGASATFAILHKLNKVESTCTVSLPLGDLILEEKNDQIYMTGPAELVFYGYVDEEDFRW